MTSKLEITAPQEIEVPAATLAVPPARAASVVENLLRRIDNDTTRPQGEILWQLAGE